MRIGSWRVKESHYCGGRPYVLVLTFLFALTNLVISSSALANSKCSPRKSEAAEKALDRFKVGPDGQRAWERFLRIVAEYGDCDDGSHGEMFDSLEIAMLDDHWEAALHFRPLLSRTPFRAFILGRIADSTMSRQEIERLRKHSTEKCGVTEAAEFCRFVREQCDQYLAAGR